jgi:valyl-tRNA synthetase
MTSPYPVFDQSRNDIKAEKELGLIMEIIMGIRNIRGEMDIKPSLRFDVLVKTQDQENEKIITKNSKYIKELARVENLTVGSSVIKPTVSASAVLHGMEIIVPLEGLMDFAEEKKRIEKGLKKLDKDIIFLEKKLSNPAFVEKAPGEVLEKDRQKLSELNEKKAKLLVNLNTIEQATSS